jgi:DNA-binding response OmpR family regulator
VIEFNEISINPDTFEASVQGQALQLTKKEFDLLVYLVTNRNRVIPKTTWPNTSGATTPTS